MKEPIHVIKVDGKSYQPSTTLCGLVGKLFAKASNTYVTPKGSFKAVLVSDMLQGPTCGKCRQVAAVMRTRNVD